MFGLYAIQNLVQDKVVAIGYIKNKWAPASKEPAPETRFSLLVNGKVSRISSFGNFKLWFPQVENIITEASQVLWYLSTSWWPLAAKVSCL